MSSIPCDHAYFSVIDLCSAFYSVPVGHETQPLSAFTHRGRQYTWTRLPQGFIDSPAVFTAVLRDALADLCLPRGSTVLQYADDLLVTAEDQDACAAATLSLLTLLAQKGFKVSRTKLQFCLTTVRYLGHDLSQGSRRLSPERVQVIMDTQVPATKHALMAFLGLINYCRQWIPDCSIYDKCLRSAISHSDPVTQPLVWTEDMLTAFKALKQALCSAPALGLPNYRLPFHLYVCNQKGTASGVLAQEHGGGMRPCAFLSKTLDAVAQGLPGCLRAVAACALMVTDAEKLVLSHPLILHTSHDVVYILRNLSTQHLSAQRRSGYEFILLATEHLTVKPSSSFDSVAHALQRLLNSQDDDVAFDSHDCLSNIVFETSIRPDLHSTPLSTGDSLFVDGSCSRPADGVFLCGYSVCRLPDEIVEAHSLPFSSAQAAELYVLTRACILAQDTDVTIYTDSRYAFGMAHDFGRIWASRGFTTADGKPISHSSLVTDLITACLLPCTLAIVKTRAHTRGDSFEIKGNSFADRVAKAAAASGVLPPGFNCALVSTDRMVSAVLPDIDLISIQASASVADTQFWDAQGATEKSGVLLDAQGRLCLPRHCTPFLVREFHGPTHRGRRGVVEDMNRTFCINNLHTDAHNILDKCLTCAQNNLSKPGAVHQHLPIPDTPFQEWQIDFTHMPKQGPFKYLLVMIDKFSRWIEAFPCSKENARTAVNKLTQEIIPRYGLPVGIDSDKGTPFTSKVTQELCKDLKINWRFHIPYHPQSSGIVERANRTIKGKLRKAMQDAGTKNWVQVLPLVLADMRMTAQVALDNLSLYELVMGRPFPVPWRRGMQVIGTGDLEVHLSEYAVDLMRVLDEYWARVNSKKPPIPEAHTHPFEVGDRVLVKRFAKLNAPMEESPYSGPTDVLAVTRTAVLTDLFPQWIHASRIKKAPM
ncbi:protein NYNRIN-like [Neoarius graeffei]|uniref:protein NYNRIN-like n=1 Tax=Neoarius graeffei TaxID=443677 RepID=UPI00298CB9B6|nr:protein NYNRIN-like [Neoarius graeffei]